VARSTAAPRIVARDGDLIVERDPRRATGRLLRQADMEASYVDLADPSHLEFDYVRWMRVALRAARARRVLHIGGGACALARSLAAEDPSRRQLVCEVDGRVLALAREHLGLRRAPGLRVRRAEGRAFVERQARGSWDAIVVDAFVGALIPRQLVTAEGLAAVARAAPLALVNVVDDRSARELRLVAAAVSEAYPRSVALVGRAGNSVLMGGVRLPDLDLVAARVAADRSPASLVAPAALSRRIAGMVAPRDADAAAS
jgi:hypothetical protein